MRHFLDIDNFSAETLKDILENGTKLKSAMKEKKSTQAKPLAGKTLAMIFSQPSTRTRISFDLGMRQLGGETLLLSGADMQMGRGESVSDTAKILSRYVDIILIRMHDDSAVRELAENAQVPVINGLTNFSHPCQVMADIMTYEEHKGSIKGKKIAWSGDGNNVLHSWIHAAQKFDFELSIATPEEAQPQENVITNAQKNGAKIHLTKNPEEAAENADCLVTDVWVSMGEDNRSNMHNLLMPYQVNNDLMARAKNDAIFMHCLPAHRGEEVTADVIDGPQSVVFDEAENRLHAQKAILAWCLQEA